MNQVACPTHFIWIDLEMTGLDPEIDRIIELAVVVTDRDLQIVAEGPIFAIYQSPEALAKMDDWNTKQHTRSGLVERVRQSVVQEAEVENRTIAFLSEWVPSGVSPMCGNTIGQDRRFLYRYMPKLEKYFHYRNLDVSTVKELAKSWHPELLKNFKKKSTHLAMDDVKESIEELRYYRDTFFKLAPKAI
jgi:oligoribonuclease